MVRGGGMEVRTSTLCTFSLLVVAVVTSGCGYTQQSKYQMSFLPPAPHHASETVELPEPPPVERNVYLGADIPAVVFSNSQVLQRRTQATPPSRPPNGGSNRVNATTRPGMWTTPGRNSTAPS